MKRATLVNVKYGQNFDVYIGRGSMWGNKFSHENRKGVEVVVGTRQEAVAAYREWITGGEGVYLLEHLHKLKGKILGCSCKPLACHGDVLLELLGENVETNSISFD